MGTASKERHADVPVDREGDDERKQAAEQSRDWEEEKLAKEKRRGVQTRVEGLLQ